MERFEFLLEFEDEDNLEVLEFIRFGLPRQINVRNNYFDTLDEAAFRRRFRLSRQCALNVLQLIEHHLEYGHDNNNSVSPMNQLLTCLRFFSTGGHLETVADYIGMHVSTASRIVVRVSEAIAENYNTLIRFPTEENNIRKIKQDFFDVAAFPNAIGAIDCSHIRIQSPGGDDAEIYRIRKSYFSINAQMICDSHLRITNVVARWPGSVHDATIFAPSHVHEQLKQDRYRNCFLLGDSGYPCKPYLFTPLANPVTESENRYNESHIRTRNVVERMFGVLKRRFPVLAYGCRLKVQTVLTIIVATSILHNICLDMGERNPPPVPEELNDHVLQRLIIEGQIPDLIYNGPNDPEAVGPFMRRRLINEYFIN